MELKDIYTTLISISNYPNVNWLEFTAFVRSAEIMDAHVSLSVIDRLFIATNVELEQINENPDRALCRYEFFEILVRIAGWKFKDSRQVTTYSEALQKLLSEHILGRNFRMPWQDYRQTKVWSNEVNLLFD